MNRTGSISKACMRRDEYPSRQQHLLSCPIYHHLCHWPKHYFISFYLSIYLDMFVASKVGRSSCPRSTACPTGLTRQWNLHRPTVGTSQPMDQTSRHKCRLKKKRKTEYIYGDLFSFFFVPCKLPVFSRCGGDKQVHVSITSTTCLWTT